MGSTKSYSFSSKTSKTVNVNSLHEMESLVIRDEDITQVLYQNYMNLTELAKVAENLHIWDIKLVPHKTEQGWLFDIERSMYAI